MLIANSNVLANHMLIANYCSISLLIPWKNTQNTRLALCVCKCATVKDIWKIIQREEETLN
jgi:hypothetical protein